MMARHLLAAGFCLAALLAAANCRAQTATTAEPDQYGGGAASYKMVKGACPSIALSVSVAGSTLAGELVLNHKPPFRAEAKGSVSSAQKVELDFTAPLSQLHGSGSLDSGTLTVTIKGTIPFIGAGQHVNTLCRWDVSAKKGQEAANVLE